MSKTARDIQQITDRARFSKEWKKIERDIWPLVEARIVLAANKGHHSTEITVDDSQPYLKEYARYLGFHIERVFGRPNSYRISWWNR